MVEDIGSSEGAGSTVAYPDAMVNVYAVDLMSPKSSALKERTESDDVAKVGLTNWWILAMLLLKCSSHSYLAAS